MKLFDHIARVPADPPGPLPQDGDSDLPMEIVFVEESGEQDPSTEATATEPGSTQTTTEERPK